jgi:hypothetical protein
MSAWDAMTGVTGSIKSWSAPKRGGSPKWKSPQRTSKKSLALRAEMSTFRRGVQVTLPTLDDVRSFNREALSSGAVSSDARGAASDGARS